MAFFHIQSVVLVINWHFKLIALLTKKHVFFWVGSNHEVISFQSFLQQDSQMEDKNIEEKERQQSTADGIKWRSNAFKEAR